MNRPRLIRGLRIACTAVLVLWHRSGLLCCFALEYLMLDGVAYPGRDDERSSSDLPWAGSFRAFGAGSESVGVRNGGIPQWSPRRRTAHVLGSLSLRQITWC